MTQADDPGWDAREEPARDLTANVTPSEIFETLWTNMADVLGTAATATLLRRSIRRTSTLQPELGAVAIERTPFDYHFSLPETWREQGFRAALEALRSLCRELRLLLVETTGPVVVRRLERIPELRQLGMTLE